MSFSRAPLKRFNEHVGCAPPPGAYDVKKDELKGAASFDKSDRFKPVKAAAEAALLPMPSSPSSNVFVSPVRRTLSADGLSDCSSAKRERSGMTLERKQQKVLEREIRSLVQQKGEQDRRLQVLEEELKKVEARLLNAVREKTGLNASVITLERQRAELKKVNEFLKNKVSADTTKKRINSLTMELMEARNNLDAKNQELSLLQINTESQLKALETDLETARATASVLNEKNKELGTEDLHQVAKTQSEELENENARLNAVIQELREDIKVLQRYLDEANDQIQDLRLKIKEKTQESAVADAHIEELKQLEMQLQQKTSELETTQVLLRQKEEEAFKFQQELQASTENLWGMEQRLHYQELELKSAQKSVMDMEKQMKLAGQGVKDSQATISQQEAELARLREVLRRTERELDERVAHLEQRCLFSEEERSRNQEEGLRRVEELKMELNLLQQAEKDERKRHIQLEQKQAALTEELAKEKALVDSLTVLVEQEREGYEARIRQLKEEMEEVLGELTVMEEQEQRRLEVIQSMQQEKGELERQLAALLDGRSSDVAVMNELHLATLRELQEAYFTSQKKMEDVVTELESTKEALKGAKEKRRELEAELGSVTQQLKEVMDKMVEQKEEEVKRLREWTEERQERLLMEEKTREENIRTMLEAQAHLAQRDEEMKTAEASHAAQMVLLQKELQVQTNEKEEALGRLEEQRSQSLTQLQHGREKSQQVLEEISQQKEEMIKQLQQEREEKVQICTALQEEEKALEAERKKHEQVRSEVHGLQAELQKLNEEWRSLLSEVELKKEFSHVLENQLSTAEQHRDQLQARLDDVEQEKVSLQAQLDLLQEKIQAVEHELENHRQDRRALREQVEVLTQEKVTLQWEMQEQQQELQRQLTQVQEESSSSSELEHWRKQYEDLLSKVRPFQEQLNAFAAERNALLNENGTNQEELNKLANAYASLLGHHNQKQKIKHVMKLKDENISLKQEVSKLRSLVIRQKSDLEQLKGKLPGAPRRRFDPSKAFVHDKENRQRETAEPLREGCYNE